jgi:hypothetical protein
MSFAGTKRYRVIRQLGVGGMGAVYEVEDATTAARVALKVMLTADPRRLLRFKQEFRLMAELHHPNLVRLFDLATEDGQWFFTMELVHGQDVLHVLTTAADVDSSASTADEPVAAAAATAARAEPRPRPRPRPSGPARRASPTSCSRRWPRSSMRWRPSTTAASSTATSSHRTC